MEIKWYRRNATCWMCLRGDASNITRICWSLRTSENSPMSPRASTTHHSGMSVVPAKSTEERACLDVTWDMDVFQSTIGSLSNGPQAVHPKSSLNRYSGSLKCLVNHHSIPHRRFGYMIELTGDSALSWLHCEILFAIRCYLPRDTPFSLFLMTANQRREVME